MFEIIKQALGMDPGHALALFFFLSAIVFVIFLGIRNSIRENEAHNKKLLDKERLRKRYAESMKIVSVLREVEVGSDEEEMIIAKLDKMNLTFEEFSIVIHQIESGYKKRPRITERYHRLLEAIETTQ